MMPYKTYKESSAAITLEEKRPLPPPNEEIDIEGGSSLVGFVAYTLCRLQKDQRSWIKHSLQLLSFHLFFEL